IVGALAVAKGGTGQTTLAAHGVVVGNAGGPVTSLTPGPAGLLLMSNGASADPSWQPASAIPPGAHHLTHEPGGSDPITALDGSVLTSGTVANARLSAQVARTDLANTFTQDQTIEKTLPILK